MEGVIQMAKEIPLQNGMFAIVDDDDYERCVEYTWSAITNGNNVSVRRFLKNSNEKWKNIYLQHFLMGEKLPKGHHSLFKNGDRLDFRKANLSIVNRSNLARVTKGNKNTSSIYKGVSWDRPRKKWSANINYEGKRTRLGRFDSEVSAALAYNSKALELFGEGAFQNVIGIDNSSIESALDKVPQRRTKNKTGFKGVKSADGGFYARIYFNKKCLHLGFHSTAEKAAKAYDEKAIELHGDKAILNFPAEYAIYR